MTQPLTHEILRRLYQYRATTLDQLDAVLPAHARKSIQRALQKLRGHDLAVWIRAHPPSDSAWFLTPDGHGEAAATSPLRPRTYILPPNSVSRHLIGTNNVGAALSRTASTYDDDDCDWEVEVAHPYGPGRVVIPDAVLHYTFYRTDGRPGHLTLFIEYDRGTEPIHTLVEKLTAYMQYRTYSGPPPKKGDTTIRPTLDWQRKYAVFPLTLFVFDNMSPAKAQRRGQLLSNAARVDPFIADNGGRLLNAAYTTLAALHDHDPFQARIITPIPNGEPTLLADRT